jgi:hypothetical protein
VANVSGNLHFVVLLHNPAMEVFIAQQDNLAVKQEESIRDLPLG